MSKINSQDTTQGSKRPWPYTCPTNFAQCDTLTYKAWHKHPQKRPDAWMQDERYNLHMPRKKSKTALANLKRKPEKKVAKPREEMHSNFIHQMRENISENLPTFIQILHSHPLIVQMGVITGLTAGKVRCRCREFFLQESDCRDRTTLTDKDWLHAAGSCVLRGRN